MITRSFDAIIIGAGQDSPSQAGRLNDAGLTVAIIERHLVGGTCVNTGCKPTKTLVASAYAAHTARRGANYGLSVAGPVEVDMSAVAARAGKVIRDWPTGNETWLAGMAHVELIRGHARFTEPHTVVVDSQALTTPRIFINVGGQAVVPDMPGVTGVPILTNTQMVALDTLPRHLVVIGGSYIGLEFAQTYRCFGAEVTIVERFDRLIAREDAGVSGKVRAILEREGIVVRTGASNIGYAYAGGNVAVSFESNGKDANLYRDAAGAPRAMERDHDKVLTLTELEARMEAVLGPDGGQLRSFEWVFSPRGADGKPVSLFDRETGSVDPAVAADWRRNYDIGQRIRSAWSKLKGDLDGKVHVRVGTADSFYLDGPVHRLESAFREVGGRAEFQFVPDATHSQRDLYTQNGVRAAFWKEMTAAMYRIARPQSGGRDHRAVRKVRL